MDTWFSLHSLLSVAAVIDPRLVAGALKSCVSLQLPLLAHLVHRVRVLERHALGRSSQFGVLSVSSLERRLQRSLHPIRRPLVEHDVRVRIASLVPLVKRYRVRQRTIRQRVRLTRRHLVRQPLCVLPRQLQPLLLVQLLGQRYLHLHEQAPVGSLVRVRCLPKIGGIGHVTWVVRVLHIRHLLAPSFVLLRARQIRVLCSRALASRSRPCLVAQVVDRHALSSPSFLPSYFSTYGNLFLFLSALL